MCVTHEGIYDFSEKLKNEDRDIKKVERPNEERYIK
jgi:hypothetical protein